MYDMCACVGEVIIACKCVLVCLCRYSIECMSVSVGVSLGRCKNACVVGFLMFVG